MGIQNVLGVNYPYPDVGDKPWGVEHIDWATAVSNATNALQGQISTVTVDLTTIQNDIINLQNDKVETSSNVGTGEGLALPKVGTDLPFKSLVAGSGITLTPAADSVTIDTSSSGGVIPIGAIIPWWDFGLLPLPTGFVYCNGAVISVVGSPLNGQTTPDLSGAYLNGFGTLGAGDIGTAPFSATTTGNTNHEVDLQHSHTVNNHNHSIPNHTHDAGSLAARLYFDFSGGNKLIWDRDPSIGIWGDDTAVGISGPAGTTGNTYNDGVVVDGITGSDGAGNTGNDNPGTNNQLSTTQNIQPQSQPCRFIMRVI